MISRTSTQQYQSKPGNLSEIAKQLGVANILEGSVQKAADQVRVNVQLIQVASDSHLWADTYDRKLVDIFGVESEVAKAIADALQAKLTGGEQQALAVKPTNNSEAYDAYLRGLALEARTSTSPSDSEKVVGFYERSVQLDPAFALAWARLSRANAQLYFSGLDTTSARRDATERALNTAQKLQPNSPETLLAQAYYQYWVLRDYELAKATFGRVRELLPGSSEVPGALALIARRQGHWDESVAYWEQTLALDPRNTQWLGNAAQTYAMLRQFPGALKTYDRVLDIVPNDPDTVASEATIYQAEGNLEQAGKLLAGVNAQTHSFHVVGAKINQLFLERHFDEAIRLIHSRLTESRDLPAIEKGSLSILADLRPEGAAILAARESSCSTTAAADGDVRPEGRITHLRVGAFANSCGARREGCSDKRKLSVRSRCCPVRRMQWMGPPSRRIWRPSRPWSARKTARFQGCSVFWRFRILTALRRRF